MSLLTEQEIKNLEESIAIVKKASFEVRIDADNPIWVKLYHTMNYLKKQLKYPDEVAFANLFTEEEIHGDTQ
jgi:hypothetical protein